MRGAEARAPLAWGRAAAHLVGMPPMATLSRILLVLLVISALVQIARYAWG